VSGYLKRKLTAQFNLLLPGGHGWPRYSDADTEEYWFGWRKRTPLSTRVALMVSVLVIGLYCWLWRLRRGPGTDPGEGLAQAEVSRVFTVRQSFLMIKSIGCLAYFSDPSVFARGMRLPEDET